MVPSGSVESDPSRRTLSTGNVIDLLSPALATGGILTAALTVIVNESTAIAPPESVTVSLKTYTPNCKPEIGVDTFAGVPMAAGEGPELCIQA